MSIDEALASYCKRCGHMQSCERMCPALEYELNEMAYEPVRLEGQHDKSETVPVLR